MAGGAYVCGGGGCSYEGGVTIFVIFTCVVAAMGGLLFGYDPGISGGVTSMESFLSKFFPFVFHKMKNETANQNQYCKFDSQLLTLFTSCLYIAALVASFFASLVTRKFGRKISMFVAGLVFLLGSILNGIANNIIVLIIGRLLLGIGVGFANQSVPVYLAEMAPTKIRGALNMGPITIGILVAGLVNFGTAKVKGGYGWRVSLALAAVPSSMMTLAAIFLPDTPNSILERGNPEKAKKMLKKIRGSDNGGWYRARSAPWRSDQAEAGRTINVSVNMLFTFIIGQVFLSMLCHLKFGLIFFFAGFVIIVTIFIAFFLPKTKNVPIEEMNRVWKAHWFWGKYIPDEAVNFGRQDKVVV
ncbi:hypothetical protein C1H46_027121 [Malus baccata]|uniref:Major facilitator superfamily (MFS) profile domain-containing protein n=1 Tax=Malus baccata TaxID=106549 RepID=A0A540LLL1_MALBA|nr:hypothetical protein C1H46_027121 [Malus baccata]